MRQIWINACLVLLAIAPPAPIGLAGISRAAEFDCLDGTARTLLHENLLGEVGRQYAARRAAVERALESPDAMLQRRTKLQGQFRQLLGEMPQRTPLRARTVDTIRCAGYRIEKVIYESRPHHRVTANLYLPDAAGRVPGVLVPCGHSDNGKASEAYQSVCVLLAQNGCAALIYDPIGQGERHQLRGIDRHGTTEHTLVGFGGAGRRMEHGQLSSLGRAAEHGLSGRTTRGRSAAARLYGQLRGRHDDHLADGASMSGSKRRPLPVSLRPSSGCSPRLGRRIASNTFRSRDSSESSTPTSSPCGRPDRP